MSGTGEDGPLLGPDRVVRNPDPPNAELTLHLQEGLLTPNDRFYVRSNFPVPVRWPGLAVAGLVEHPADDLDLEPFERRRLVVTLECAGNGRAYLDPPAPGEQWELGAVSTAEWSGVPLAAVLEVAGLRPCVVEVVFEGADGYAGSLPLETALHPDTLLVLEMNGRPLPRVHGGPLRLLVPRWYGMASVKWLTRVAPAGEPFRGHFQSETYVIEGRHVREMEVRAVVTRARPGRARGYARTGRGSIVRVELSADGGQSFFDARLTASAPPYGWTGWEADWSAQGSAGEVVIVRASDSEGREQPLEQRWNELGYANNQARPVTTEGA